MMRSSLKRGIGVQQDCRAATRGVAQQQHQCPTCSSTFCMEKSAVTLTMLLSDSRGRAVLAVPASLGAVPASVPAPDPSSDIHSSLSESAR